ncbi:VPS4-associated protein 1 [Aspergillus taichungensis]|uniref:VPS4-associated protein 1 n=1 Tax=Aspergillus taichungensis TaxID=482145 RepID=A0A2J5HNR5_9EURO|nr:VPS4-associated protein 1 [Aspergillus taichungensis]
MSLPNIYHLRRVADTAAKACSICYKPSSCVLITPDNKDYFYVCATHLKDRHFCTPIVDTEGAAAKKKKEEEEALQSEIEAVKREYEERQRMKKNKNKSNDEEGKKDEDGDEGKDKDGNKKGKGKEEDGDGKKSEKERDDKIDSLKKSASSNEPRIFALHKTFYQMRLDRIRNAETARRNLQRMQDPSFFPSVPSGGV